MNQKKSIHDWELYHKLKGNKPSIKKEFVTYKKPILGIFWDFLCKIGQRLIKKPIFSLLLTMNVILLGSYFNCMSNGEHIEMFRWVTTTSFMVFFGYFTFFDKN